MLACVTSSRSCDLSDTPGGYLSDVSPQSLIKQGWSQSTHMSDEMQGGGGLFQLFPELRRSNGDQASGALREITPV